MNVEVVMQRKLAEIDQATAWFRDRLASSQGWVATFCALGTELYDARESETPHKNFRKFTDKELRMIAMLATCMLDSVLATAVPDNDEVRKFLENQPE